MRMVRILILAASDVNKNYSHLLRKYKKATDHAVALSVVVARNQ